LVASVGRERPLAGRDVTAPSDLGGGVDSAILAALRRLTSRHAQIDVTMNVYTDVSDAKTRQALKRLGRQLGG
jgi:hypothetical protein